MKDHVGNKKDKEKDVDLENKLTHKQLFCTAVISIDQKPRKSLYFFPVYFNPFLL